jgi:hypothetical protein
LINGVNHGAIYTYTFENVQEHGTIAVVFVENVGVDESTLAKIRIYPNPTTGQLRIENGQLPIEHVELYDVYGRKVSFHLERGRNEANISHLPSGVYFVKIRTEAGEVVKKVVKE